MCGHPLLHPRAPQPPCLQLPAAAQVKFCFLPTRPGWVGRTAQNHPTTLDGNERETTLAHQRGCHLAINSAFFDKISPLSRKCASCFSRFFANFSRFLAKKNGKKLFVKEVHFLLGRKSSKKPKEEHRFGLCQGSVLPVGQNWGEICRTNAGQGRQLKR